MKHFLAIIAILMLSTQFLAAEESCFGTSCLPERAQRDCTVMESNGCIDWENGIIYATGMGVPNPDFKTQAQRSYSALEAAKTVAMRNLLQMVEGINISSTKTVKAGMLENDTIETQISGQLRHVIEAGRPKKMNDGSVWVTMKMYLRDIMSVLVDNQQFETQDTAFVPMGKPDTTRQTTAATEDSPSESAQYGGDANTIYGGLIIDATNLNISPAMSPKVYDSEGREVYGSAAVERDFALRHGIVGYVKSIEKARNNDRIKGKPLVIKAERSSNGVDLKISDQDAELLRTLDSSQTFLREARVIIVVS